MEEQSRVDGCKIQDEVGQAISISIYVFILCI